MNLYSFGVCVVVAALYYCQQNLLYGAAQLQHMQLLSMGCAAVGDYISIRLEYTAVDSGIMYYLSWFRDIFVVLQTCNWGS